MSPCFPDYAAGLRQFIVCPPRHDTEWFRCCSSCVENDSNVQTYVVKAHKFSGGISWAERRSKVIDHKTGNQYPLHVWTFFAHGCYYSWWYFRTPVRVDWSIWWFRQPAGLIAKSQKHIGSVHKYFPREVVSICVRSTLQHSLMWFNVSERRSHTEPCASGNRDNGDYISTETSGYRDWVSFPCPWAQHFPHIDALERACLRHWQEVGVATPRTIETPCWLGCSRCRKYPW